MFGMSMTEMMIILVVALIVLGPNDLPKAAKTIGKTLRDLQRAGDDLRDTFQREVMDEPTKPKAPPPGVVSSNPEEVHPNAPPPALPIAPPESTEPRAPLSLAPPIPEEPKPSVVGLDEAKPTLVLAPASDATPPAPEKESA